MSDDLVKRLRGVVMIREAMGDGGLQRVCDVRAAADRIEELEAKLASVISAYRIEAMRRDHYSHEAFDQHIAELKK